MSILNHSPCLVHVINNNCNCFLCCCRLDTCLICHPRNSVRLQIIWLQLNHYMYVEFNIIILLYGSVSQGLGTTKFTYLNG